MLNAALCRLAKVKKKIKSCKKIHLNGSKNSFTSEKKLRMEFIDLNIGKNRLETKQIEIYRKHLTFIFFLFVFTYKLNTPFVAGSCGD